MPQLTSTSEKIMHTSDIPLDQRFACYFQSYKSTEDEQGAAW